MFPFRYLSEKKLKQEIRTEIKTKNTSFNYGTPEGTFPFRYLSEKKWKQGNKNGNQNKKYLV